MEGGTRLTAQAYGEVSGGYLLGVEGAILAREALANDLRVLVDEYSGWGLQTGSLQ